MKYKIAIIIISIILYSCADVLSSLKNKNGQNAIQKKSEHIYSEDEIVRLINAETTNSLKPIKRDGKAVVESIDFNGDGNNDLAAFFVETTNSNIANYEYLSSMKNLYSADSIAHKFKVLVFSFEREGAVLKTVIDLGKRKLLKEIKFSGSSPAIIEMVFQSLRYIEHVFVSADIAFNESVLLLNESSSSLIKLEDIDNDNLTDIIHFETGFEEGMGEELFATWYKWNGFKYTNYKSIALIRVLNKFLSDSREYLLSGDLSGFAEFSLMNNRQEAPEVLLNKIFRSESGKGFIQDKKIIDIVFPEILENPFDLEHGEEYFFEILVKQINETGNSFFKCSIIMDSNPFKEKRFYFSLD